MAVRTIAHSLHLACQVHMLTQGNAPRSRLMSKICGGADTCCWEETEETKVRGPNPNRFIYIDLHHFKVFKYRCNYIWSSVIA